ncbi:MAG: retropepsin-like aspartic protease [Methanobacteriota archaeon]
MNPNEFVFEYNDYPLIPIKFNYDGKETPYIDALLDSGGDFIVIPLAIARFLKLKLQKAGSVDTAGGTTSLFRATVDMTLGSAEEKIGYTKLEIHVSMRNDIPVLLGRCPIFEDYEIVFKKHKKQLILTPIKTL